MMAGRLADLRAALQHADEAAAAPSPESAPYEAQYRALEVLHKLLSVEAPPAEEAVIRARRGAVFLAVEEPHNAQKDLDAALAFFCPALAEFAAAVPEREEPATRGEVDALVQKIPSVQVSEEHQEYFVYILELLNQLGILWSNRSQPTRALCYLLACNNLSKSLAESDTAIASVRTHTHFYLAQVFGALGLPEESAKYCLATLEQQLLTCVNGASEGGDTQFQGAREWVKNALRLVDYYIDTENIKDAATCLSACEYMMAHHLPEDDDVEEDEQRADMFAAWAKVHQTTLQIAHLRREGYPAGVRASGGELPCPSMEATLLKISPDATAASGPKMVFVPSSSVTSYDQARDVFKMGVAATEQAKKVFVLDGFVTRHVRVLQQESLLYKRLIAFEPDSKRQIAMQLRRLALLSPLLGEQLNPRAYCDLLQELYFECAEVAVEIFDLKRSRKGELDAKTNGYAVKAAHWYHQFVSLYYSSGDASSTTRKEVVVQTGPRAVLPPQEMSPREVRALLRGYFGLAHICGKIMYSRDIPKTATFWKRSLEAHEAVLAIAKQCEKKQKPGAQQETIEELFGAELAICRDMVTLLPEKIDQLVYNGRAL